MKHRPTSAAALVVAGTLAAAGFALAQGAPPSSPPSTPSNQPPSSKQPKTPPDRPHDGVGANLHAGYMETPKYAQRLTTSLAENTIEVFDEADFQGEMSMQGNVTEGHQNGTLNAFPDKFDNSATSLRWNLAPGVLVVMFDDAAGKGEQLALWGKGQIPDLAHCNYNNQATRWSWYDVGGGESRSAESILMPQGSLALNAAVASDSVQLFDKKDFKDDHQVISGVTNNPSGEWRELPGAAGISGEKENAASSLRWDLPEGVIVLLSAKDDGTSDIVLFGKAQYDDLAKCDFNNCASRWSWAYIGKPAMGDGKEEPR